MNDLRATWSVAAGSLACAAGLYEYKPDAQASELIAGHAHALAYGSMGAALPYGVQTIAAGFELAALVRRALTRTYGAT